MSRESMRWSILILWFIVLLPLELLADFTPVSDYMSRIGEKLATLVPTEQEGVLVSAKPLQTFTAEQKQAFCINVRGWMLPTNIVFERLQLLAFSDNSWEEEDIKLVHALVSKSFGYALYKLFKSVNSPQHQALVRIMSQYLPDRPLCPIACSYDDYRVIEQGINTASKASFNRICSRNCRQVPVASASEFEWCKCLLAGEACSDKEMQTIVTAEAVQRHVFSQKGSDYESLFRYKKP